MVRALWAFYLNDKLRDNVHHWERIKRLYSQELRQKNIITLQRTDTKKDVFIIQKVEMKDTKLVYNSIYS